MGARKIYEIFLMHFDFSAINGGSVLKSIIHLLQAGVFSVRIEWHLLKALSLVNIKVSRF